jgi:hypothetical protein
MKTLHLQARPAATMAAHACCSPCTAACTQGGSGRTVVTGLPAGFIADLQWLLRTAYLQHGLLVAVSLWSHDILAVRRGNSVTNRARAVLMMTDDGAAAAYVDNALLPMLAALRQPMAGAGGATYLDAVLAWEVLNEPEGVSRHWRLYKVRRRVAGSGMLVCTQGSCSRCRSCSRGMMWHSLRIYCCLFLRAPNTCACVACPASTLPRCPTPPELHVQHDLRQLLLVCVCVCVGGGGGGGAAARQPECG